MLPTINGCLDRGGADYVCILCADAAPMACIRGSKKPQLSKLWSNRTAPSISFACAGPCHEHLHAGMRDYVPLFRLRGSRKPDSRTPGVPDLPFTCCDWVRRVIASATDDSASTAKLETNSTVNISRVNKVTRNAQMPRRQEGHAFPGKKDSSRVSQRLGSAAAACCFRCSSAQCMSCPDLSELQSPATCPTGIHVIYKAGNAVPNV